MFLYYILVVNIFGAIFFISDKTLAKNGKRRVSEKRLHSFEFAGAALSIIPLMYLIRHKNRKKSYFLYTWLALIVWIAILYFYFANLQI